MGIDQKYLNRQIAAADPEDAKSSVRFVITDIGGGYGRVGNVITSSSNEPMAVQDGVTPNVGDDFLLTDLASQAGADNGIYTATDLGSGGSDYVWTRRTDADADDLVTSGMSTKVEEGTMFSPGTEFVLLTPNPIVLNTTALDIQEVVAGGSAGFSVIPVDEVTTIAENEEVIITGARIDGQLVVRGRLVILRPSNVRQVLDPIFATLPTAVPNNSSVPVDPRAGALSITLPNKGTPGETVKVKNITDSANVITVLAGGYPIDGANSFLLNSAREIAVFERQSNQTWSMVV